MIAKLRSEKGVILLLTIILLPFLLILMGITSDFMRMFLVKREVQDAIDAAVLSAALIDSEKSQSQYIFQVWDTCTACDEDGCWDYCCNPHAISIVNKTIPNPHSLISGYCSLQYRGEYNRWIAYDKGASPTSIAEDIFEANISNSRIIQKAAYQIAEGPHFYVQNNRSSSFYPSVTGEVKIIIKPYIIKSFLGVSDIPIICRSQANTHYEKYENGRHKGQNPIPAIFTSWAIQS